jgi:plasmid stabilization system protein ParE
MKTCSLIPDGPLAIAVRGLRFWVISRIHYLIYYLLDDQGVGIERVLDGRHDVARMIELGTEEPIG